jgi:putative spermidine/putrescine transport system substrate-binding protein
MESTITRRSFVGGATGAALAAPYVISSEVHAQNTTLYVNTWGGSWEAAEKVAFFEPFTKQTGIAIRTVAPVSYAKLKAQVRARNYDFDVTTAGRAELMQAVSEGLLEPIDASTVKLSDLWPEAFYKGHGVGSTVLATCLVYRKDKFPNGGPQSWADFWNVEKFPGRRSLYDAATRTIGFALLADGVPLDKLFPMDYDRAFKSLDRIKKHVRVWWKEGNQSQQLIRDGEVDMIAMWNARASELINQGVPLAIVWNGANIRSGNWVVPKGTPRAKQAWEFINFASQAVPQSEFAKRMYYGMLNPKAMALLPPEILAQMPTAPANRPLGWESDYEWEAQHLARITDQFKQWLAS